MLTAVEHENAHAELMENRKLSQKLAAVFCCSMHSNYNLITVLTRNEPATKNGAFSNRERYFLELVPEIHFRVDYFMKI